MVYMIQMKKITHLAIQVQVSIGRLIIRHPVQLSDGHSYEKREIKRWLKRSTKSPLTGLPLASIQMTDNVTLRSIIQDDMQNMRRLNSALGSVSRPLRHELSGKATDVYIQSARIVFYLPNYSHWVSLFGPAGSLARVTR